MADFPTAPNKAMMDKNSDEYWKARSDASTLKEAELIKADQTRSQNAAFILEQEAAARKKALAAANKSAKKK